jgi:AraC-like DNA-binding protein
MEAADMNETYGSIEGYLPAKAPAERAGYLVRQALTFLDTDRQRAQRCLNDAAALLPQAEQRTFQCGLARWQARRVLDYIDGNLGSRLTISELARLVALSESHFSRAFRRALGSPPVAFIALRRIERAKHMMRSTLQPLCTIALACGFSDQPHFNRSFRRWVGMSPGSWRRGNE